MNAERIRQEVGEALAAKGVPMVAVLIGVCTIQRAWIQSERSPVEYWIQAIETVCANAIVGTRAEVVQVTLLPCDHAIEHMKEAHSGENVIIHRFKYWIAIPGKRWVGLHSLGISPTNAELADPRNWEAIT